MSAETSLVGKARQILPGFFVGLFLPVKFFL